MAEEGAQGSDATPTGGGASDTEKTTIEVLATVGTLTEYATLIGNLAKEGRKIWFRGARKNSYDLLPGLYRHPQRYESFDLLGLEWQLLSDYRHQAPPFTRQLPEADLELLFLMQHYRVPTRLLDWSENPFIALFFAVENARGSGIDSIDDASVWVLDPIKLNVKAFSTVTTRERIMGAWSKELSSYLPSRMPQEISAERPCAVFGVHNSPRIVAQRGAFVLYGADIRSMEQQPELLAGEDKVLRKIVIKGDSKGDIFDHLFNMGVSDSVVYPDLDGLSRELRNRRGF